MKSFLENNHRIVENFTRVSILQILFTYISFRISSPSPSTIGEIRIQKNSETSYETVVASVKIQIPFVKLSRGVSQRERDDSRASIESWFDRNEGFWWSTVSHTRR